MNKNDKQVIFRNSIGGYNKKDVNEYISELNDNCRRREDEADSARQRAERRADDERKSKEEATKRLDELAIEVYSAQNELNQKQPSLKTYTDANPNSRVPLWS